MSTTAIPDCEKPSVSRYVQGCRCAACREAERIAHKQRRIRSGCDYTIGNGNIPERIHFLRDAGLRDATIARIWGVSFRTVNNQAEPGTIRASTAKLFMNGWEVMLEAARNAQRLGRRI